jgi:hypothetical protein
MATAMHNHAHTDPAAFPVVGIGASAGGLDACRKLVHAVPAESGMAFILVQHLDPTHPSMMVDLLATHTTMLVVQATDGMLVEVNHFYVIPPGKYLSAGAAWRAAAVRFSAQFHGRGLWRSGHVRGTVGHRRGWQHRPAGGEARGRAGDRAGPGGGRLWRHAA